MPILNTRGNASATGFGFTSGGPSIVLLSATPGPSATISTYSGYIVFKFTATGTLNVGAGAPGTADVFVVAGGASGDGFSTTLGGAGGSRTESPAFTITANSPIPVVVGGTATNSTFGPVTSSGGTGGGSAGAAGGGTGGNGPSNGYETGSPQAYGGGGGGGGVQTSPLGYSPGGAGGQSGGGPGGPGGYTAPRPSGFFPVAAVPGTNGTANTGGGGGGGGSGGPAPTTGGTGGSGVVIVRFPNTQFRTS